MLHDAAHFVYEVPVLAFATRRQLLEDKAVILIPDPFALTDYGPLLREVDKGIRRYPWHKKIAKVFWRGSASGLGPENNDINGFPRIRFLNYARTLDFTDVGFVGYTTQLNPHFRERVAALHPLKPAVSPRDSLAYKYLIDIDGNTCSFTRMAWLLYSNSLVFKHESPDVQWYYAKMQPYVHYLPISSDFKNLQQQYKWAQTHPKAAMQIAKNAHNLAARVFTRSAILQSLADACSEYAAIAAY